MIGQFVINGLITGVLYTLVAIGFALVYNTTRLFHMAAVALYVFAAYMFYLFAVPAGLPILLAGLLSMALTMGLSLLTDVAMYRPLKCRGASDNVSMIASIGLMTVIINALAMLFGNETKVIDLSVQSSFSAGGVILSASQVWQFVLGGSAVLLFIVLLRRSGWGVRLKAYSSDAALCEILGYDALKMRTWVFLLSGAFLSLGSCLAAYDTGLNTDMGMVMLINGLVAMIIGGVGNLEACLLGGLSLGILQSITVFFFPSSWQSAVTFVVLVILLFLRPQGIAGYRQRVV
jgi:branched-subunit amino acid ABC-type transport system permease component